MEHATDALSNGDNGFRNINSQPHIKQRAICLAYDCTYGYVRINHTHICTHL